MFRNIMLVSISTSLIGCAVDFSDTLPDYNGSDIAYIRVENTLQQTPFKIEKKIPAGDCWKSEHTYGVTSKVAIMGLRIRTSKNVAGIAPPSENFSNKSYQEYSIQSGYDYKVWWKSEQRSMYGLDLGRTFTGGFNASKGHTYEISSEYSQVKIVDLSNGKSENPSSSPECRYERDMFGKKKYF